MSSRFRPVVLSLLVILFAIFHTIRFTRQAEAQPEAGTLAIWTEVTETRSCPGGACPAGRGFAVDRSGVFRSGHGQQGALSEQEFAQLNRLATAVAGQDLTVDLLCDGTAGEPGLTVTLEKGAPSYVIYEGRNDRSLCNRTTVESALALKENLDQLAAKYDRVQPGIVPLLPTPSPIPSPSPSPSPGECFGVPDGTACMGGCAPPSCDTGCTEGAWCQSGSCVPFIISCPSPATTPLIQ